MLCGLGDRARRATGSAATACPAKPGAACALTDLLKVRRTAYVGLLALLTGGLTYGYLAWSQTDVVGFLRYHWAWGLLAAALTIGLNLGLIRLLVRRGRLRRLQECARLGGRPAHAWAGVNGCGMP